MRLLVFDDDPMIVQLVADVAGQSGWSVETATREAEFRTRFAAGSPDAIMLDLQLGASDGIQQLQFLHRHGYTGVVALMSGFDTRVLAAAQQVGQSLGIRIAAVMEKPARVARIRAVLREIETVAAMLPDPPPTAPPAARTRDEAITPALIAAALGGGEMELHFQPIVAAGGRSVCGVEGLIRWHRHGGLVRPDAFIPIAEQDEAVIDQLTRWAVTSGVDCYRRLAALGLAVPIWINISGMNLHSLDFPDEVAALLERAGVPSDAIGLEVTESVAMRDLGAAAVILTRLRLKGFALAIDDFGTGHASLEALRQMPFSSIKINKSFVDHLQSSPDAHAIIKSIVDLAGSLGLTSVAEGVDSAETARLLTELGVACLQGYYFSHPLPFDRLTEC